jgi:hypothetical protein
MPSVITFTGPNTLSLAIPSSFVATAPDRSLDSFGPWNLADFWIGPGGWIVQAKATVRNPNPQEIADVKLYFTLAGDPLGREATLTTVRGGYATVSLALGLQLSESTHVELRAEKTHLPLVDLSNVVVIGIKENQLTLVKL